MASIYAFQNHPRCGRFPRQLTQHTNGAPETSTNHPWVVAIMLDQDNDLHCTGSIISSKYILTAAHCMRGMDKSKLEIVLGAKNLKDPRNSRRGVIKRRINDYQLHDKNEGGADYDIAVVEVVDEIPFENDNPRIWPICLPEKSNNNANHLQFRGMKVLGYGPEDDEELILTSIDLNIKPIPHCNDKYTVGRSTRYFWEIEDALPNKFNGGSIFCASNVGTEAGTCRGDSGGPTVFNDGIKYHQLGVVHGSITSCDGSRFPGIFLRIDNPEVFDWLSKVTSSGLVTGLKSPATCPSSPNHIQIKGSCVYFEQKELNWQEALDNCRNKFVPGSGRLFEPRNSSINQAVWEAADDKLGDSSDGEFWLGMNDLKDGTYRYESDGNEVVDGMWESEQPNIIDQHCVGYLYRDQWWDLDCSELRMSICEEGG